MIGPMQKSKLILISPIFSINTVRTVNDVRYIGGPQDQKATPGSALEWLAVKLDKSHPNHISKPPRVSLTMIFWGSLYDIIGGPHNTFLYLFFVLNFLFSLFLPEIFTPNQSHSFRFLKHQIIGTYFILHGHFGQVDLQLLNIQQALEGGI